MVNKEIENHQLPGKGSEPEAPYNNRSLKDWLVLAFLIVLVVSLGMLAVNQTLEFFYKSEFLRSPCGLCGKLNPEVEQCIDHLNAPRASFPDGNGGWTDPFSLPDDVEYAQIEINYNE